jgi:pimeloyl-ACP methyl ester carboxylesterase
MRPAVSIMAVALALVAVADAPAQRAFSTYGGTLRLRDGTRLAWTLRVPKGEPLVTGFPAIILEHGGTDTRQGEGTVLTAEEFALSGYATLTYDRRGYGDSSGRSDLAGKHDVADLRALRQWLASRPGINPSAIGGWGGSVGGAVLLNAVAAGVPFAAVTVFETWTDLAGALLPQGIARSLSVNQILSLSPALVSFASPVERGRAVASLRRLLVARSSLGRLGSVRTPLYLFQGRDDWLFDIGQATRAFLRLKGPRKLYIGAFGHAPSSFPGPDFDYVASQWHAWFDRFLEGRANGVESGPPVQLARDDGAAHISYDSLPPTTTVSIPLKGSGRLRLSGPLARPLETFGGGDVHVSVTRIAHYPQLVATVLLLRPGSPFPLVVTEGAVRPRAGANTIDLANDCVVLPAGARIEVRLGRGSGFSGSYLPYGHGTVTIGTVALRLRVLNSPVSRYRTGLVRGSVLSVPG